MAIVATAIEKGEERVERNKSTVAYSMMVWINIFIRFACCHGPAFAEKSFT